MDLATYLGALSSGFVAVFSWPTFPLMLLGVAIGFVIGILPGISAPTTLALMLPFTFAYDHRVIDGAAGVRFTTFLAERLADVKGLMEAVP